MRSRELSARRAAPSPCRRKPREDGCRSAARSFWRAQTACRRWAPHSRRTDLSSVLVRTRRYLHMRGMVTVGQRLKDLLARWTFALPSEEANLEALHLLKDNLSPGQRDQLELFNYFDIVGGDTGARTASRRRQGPGPEDGPGVVRNRGSSSSIPDAFTGAQSPIRISVMRSLSKAPSRRRLSGQGGSRLA